MGENPWIESPAQKCSELIIFLFFSRQEATVRTGHGTTDWFQIGKGVPVCFRRGSWSPGGCSDVLPGQPGSHVPAGTGAQVSGVFQVLATDVPAIQKCPRPRP